MINIVLDPKNYELSLSGHAGQAEEGHDIVCSAVSILFYTLAEALERSSAMLKKHPIIKIENGNGYIKCRPIKEYQGNISRTYWTVLVGMEILAEEYKEYINFSVKE